MPAKLKRQDVRKELLELGLEMIEYKNTRNVIYKCHCGKECKKVLNDIRKGSRCMECGKDKIKKTNIERYGVENPFQSEYVRDKIKKTNIERYGVERTHFNQKKLRIKLKRLI